MPPSRLASAWKNLLLPGLLGTLYFALWAAPTSLLGRAFFVVHLGLFIIWQPFVRRDHPLSVASLFAILLVSIGILVSLQGWMLVIWIMTMAAIIGGRVPLFGERLVRVAYQLVFAFLLLALLLIAVPAILPITKVPEHITQIGYAGLLFMILAVIPLLLQAGIQNHVEDVVDFISSLLVFLLLATLILGTLAVMLTLDGSYIDALLQSLLLIGAALLLLGWAWNPHAGFSGLGGLFSRYLMSIGLPIERWLDTLANLAMYEDDPEIFLEQACTNMAKSLQWVSGVEWISSRKKGQFGLIEGYCSVYSFEGVTLHIHTRHRLTAALIFHFNLMAKLMAEFYADKVRASALKKMSYMKAIHETGARLTHDVKNILQTLNVLCSAANEPEAASSATYQALVRRQLPAIATRLAETLVKLEAPSEDMPVKAVSASMWWEELQERVAFSSWISLVSSGVSGDIPAEVFSNVVENLIRNASDKRLREPALKMRLELIDSNGPIELLAYDDGSPIAEEVSAGLLAAPVKPKNGLGIGLYQAAHYAELAGYRLTLAENRAGCVCFRLASIESR
ncbi:MAG: sensor histidine kinase [Rhodocyclales bacterium]|nr:sensor histidine kinase [Rhodocyclales bacterium]